jgi:serine/threonine-protein kinase
LLNATTGTRAAYVPKPIPPEPAGPHSTTATPLALDAAVLDSLEKKLAHHVGPMARILVTRATAKAASRAELVRLLAAEVDSTSARQQFIEACQATVP